MSRAHAEVSARGARGVLAGLRSDIHVAWPLLLLLLRSHVFTKGSALESVGRVAESRTRAVAKAVFDRRAVTSALAGCLMARDRLSRRRTSRLEDGRILVEDWRILVEDGRISVEHGRIRLEDGFPGSSRRSLQPHTPER